VRTDRFPGTKREERDKEAKKRRKDQSEIPSEELNLACKCENPDTDPLENDVLVVFRKHLQYKIVSQNSTLFRLRSEAQEEVDRNKARIVFNK
jgi:hypothetical protein